MGVRLRSILTSSHIRRPEGRRSWCLQETAFDQCLCGQTCSVRKPPPPAFLFPNQRCQRPDRRTGPTVLRPVAAKSGVSSCRSRSCQPAYFAPSKKSSAGFFRAQKSHRGRRGASLLSPIRVGLKERRLCSRSENSKHWFGEYPSGRGQARRLPSPYPAP